MKKRLITFLFIVLLISLFVACSKDDNNNENNNNNNNVVENNNNNNNNDNDNNDNNGNNNNDNEENETVNASELDFNEILDDLEEQTDGIASVYYETDEVQVHEEEEYEISLNGYVVVELEDFHQNFAIPFDSEDEGAVLLAHVTIKNKLDEEIAYVPTFSLTYNGADRYPGPQKDLISEESQLIEMLRDNDHVLEAKETVSGYVAMNLRTYQIDEIDSVGKASFEVPPAGDEYDADEYSEVKEYGAKTEFTIVVSEEGSEREKESAKF